VKSDTKIALIGSYGMLGQRVKAGLPAPVRLTEFNFPEFDFLNPADLVKTLRDVAPDVIINCSAFTAVDNCEKEEAAATRINGEGPALLAGLACEKGSVLVHISTDYVFDGRSSTPYRESDLPSPLSAYGRSKLAGEKAVLDSGLESFFIIRTSWLYGPGGPNFVETILRLAAEREELRIVADQVGSPTLTDDLAEAIFRLLATGEYGVYHFSNEGFCSWYEFACAIVQGARDRGLALPVKQILPIATADYPLPAPRPAFSLLSKEKYREQTGCEIPHWRDGLNRYLDWRIKKDVSKGGS